MTTRGTSSRTIESAANATTTNTGDRIAHDFDITDRCAISKGLVLKFRVIYGTCQPRPWYREKKAAAMLNAAAALPEKAGSA
jgi:hypothetical protein